MSIISNLIRKSKTIDGPLNILSFFYDGKFDIDLLETGHEFYGLLEHSSYQWPGYKSAMYPNLHILENPNEINITDFDLVIFNNRYAHAQFFGICRQLHIPGLIIDHDMNMQNAFNRIKNKQFTTLPHISTNDFIKKQYGAEESINYGIDPKNWEHEKDIDILCMVSLQTDIALAHQLKKQFPSASFIGHNPNIPYAGLVENYEEYKDLFKRARVFVNLSNQVNLNYDILFALNNKIPIITLDLPIYKDILTDDNSIKVNDSEQLFSKIKQLSFDKTLYNKISNFTTDLNQFSKADFVNRWKEVLVKHASRVYIE